MKSSKIQGYVVSEYPVLIELRSPHKSERQLQARTDFSPFIYTLDIFSI